MKEPIHASSPRDVCRATEDLRAPLEALQMAASGIAAGMHANTVTSDGVYFLLLAIADQLESTIGKLESICGMTQS